MVDEFSDCDHQDQYEYQYTTSTSISISTSISTLDPTQLLGWLDWIRIDLNLQSRDHTY